MNFRLIQKASKHNYFQGFSTILKVSALKTVTIESGVKNPIQRTTFYLQRTSGARVMTCSDAVNTRVGDGLGTVSDAVNTRVGDGLGTLKTHLGTIWSSLGEPVPPKKFRGNRFPRPTLYDFLFPNSKNPSSAAWLGKKTVHLWHIICRANGNF